MPERNPTATWETCPYYHSAGDGIRPHCRRRAIFLISGTVALSGQQITGSSERYAGAFPTVPEDCWCGEHPDFFTGA